MSAKGENVIEVQNLVKVYGKKKAQQFIALDDVSLMVDKGTSVAIVGKSGSGKSTLMHVMSGLDRATSGSIAIDGEEITRMKPRAVDKFRAHKMSFIFQSFFVQGNETCYDNVSLPLEIADVPRSQRRKKVEAALEAVQLGDKIHQKAKNLSGGQKQRLAIARAIVNSPELLFADEPTGNLDSNTGQAVEDLLFSYQRAKGATLIIVTHDDDLASRCDRQVYVKDGKIIRDEAAKGANK